MIYIEDKKKKTNQRFTIYNHLGEVSWRITIGDSTLGMSPKLSPILRGGFDAHMLSLSNSSRGRLRLPLLDWYSMEMTKTHCVFPTGV